MAEYCVLGLSRLEFTYMASTMDVLDLPLAHNSTLH
jgi:hypothetical protein